MEPSTATETARELLSAFRSLKQNSKADPLLGLKQKLDKAQGDLRQLEEKWNQLEKLERGETVNVPFATGSLAFIPATLNSDSDETIQKSQVSLSRSRELLVERRKALRDLIQTLKAQAFQQASTSVQDTLRDTSPGKDGIVLNEDHQILNEEGLPFFEPVEKVPDSPPLTATSSTSAKKEKAPGFVLPFERAPEEKARTKEQRRKWMDEILGKYEKEEEEGLDEEEVADDSDEHNSDDEEGDDPLSREIEEQEEGDLDPSRITSVVHVPRTTPPRTPSPPDSVRPDMHRVVSSERPPPGKSVLKVSKTPPQIQQNNGFKRGFLNLNPSSPASEFTSNPIESHFNGSNLQKLKDEKNDEERLSRSLEIPNGKDGKKKKKAVRIQSPEARRGELVVESEGEFESKSKKGMNSSSPKGKSSQLDDLARDLSGLQSQPSKASHPQERPTRVPREKADEGVADEAARIIELLGPNVVSDLDGPSSASSSKREQQPLAVEAPLPPVPTSARPKKPAVGQAVMERVPGSPKASPPVVKPQQKVSAFKRGFLSNSPQGSSPHPALKSSPLRESVHAAPSTPASPGDKNHISNPPLPSIPQAPRVSLGLSALDRASKADAPIEKQRAKEGLPPAVPHARPTKAFAEKLEAKRKAQEEGSSLEPPDIKEEEVGEVLARPTAADDEPEEGRVRFAAPSSKAPSSAPAMESKGKEKAAGFSPPPKSSVRETSTEDHDEEAEVDEIGTHQEGDSDSDDVEEQQFQQINRSDVSDEEIDEDYDSDDDDEEGWDSDDIASLQPSFEAMIEDFDNAELAREYIMMREQWQRSSNGLMERMMGQGGDDENVDEDEDELNLPLPPDASIPDQNLRTSAKSSRVSRFKAESLAREASSSSSSANKRPNPHDSVLLSSRSKIGGGVRLAPSQDDPDAAADQAGHELAHLLLNAQNAGPSSPSGKSQEALGSSSSSSSSRSQPNHVSPQEATLPKPAMVIPSLPPVRFPARDFNREDEFKGAVVLDESDEEESREDERLQQIMKERIEARDRRENRKRIGIEEKERQEASLDQNVPPAVQSKKPATVSDAQPLPPKKVSRFMASRRDG